MRCLLLLLFALPCSAAWVEVNVDQSVNVCGVWLDTLPKTTILATAPVPPATQKKCRFNVDGITPGTHDVRFSAIVDHPVWGTLESVQSPPFVFARPATPPAPASPALVP